MSQLTKEEAIRLTAINLMATVCRHEVEHHHQTDAAETQEAINKRLSEGMPSALEDFLDNQLSDYEALVLSLLGSGVPPGERSDIRIVKM